MWSSEQAWTWDLRDANLQPALQAFPFVFWKESFGSRTGVRKSFGGSNLRSSLRPLGSFFLAPVLLLNESCLKQTEFLHRRLASLVLWSPIMLLPYLWPLIFRVNIFLFQVQLSLQTKSTSTTECLGLWDVQDLFLCPLLGKSLNVPDWLKLPSLSNVLRAVVVLISAVGKQLYEENKDCFPNLSGLFEVVRVSEYLSFKKVSH